MRLAFLIMMLAFSITPSRSQLLPPNQPEQDACYAINLCGDIFYSSYSYQGTGRLVELSSSPCGALATEGNSMWLRVEAHSKGSMVFVIQPVNPLDDYDFLVVNATGKSCRSLNNHLAMQLSLTDVIRCNYNNNQTGNAGYLGPEIGLNNISQLQFVRTGTTGSNFLQQIDADSGDVYLILINNWGTGGGPSSGFSIDFSGSTAGFRKDPPPLYDSLQIACGISDSISVFLNAKVDCQSIAADGSDFIIEPLGIASVIHAEGVDCNGSDGYTEHIVLKLDSPLPGGSYTLKPRTGSDGNSLLNACRIEQPLTDSIHFAAINPSINLGEDRITCINNSIQLNAQVEGTGGAYSIRWSPAVFLNNAAIADPICMPSNDVTYTVTVRPEDQPWCSATDSIHIELLKGFELLHKDTAICLGASVNLIVQGDSRYQYTWTPDPGMADPMNLSIRPDSTTMYTVTASYTGCKDSAQSVLIDVDRSVLYAFLDVKVDKKHLCVGEYIHIVSVTDSASLYLSWTFDGVTYESQPAGLQHAFDHQGIIPVSVTSHYKACPPVAYADTFHVYPFPVVLLPDDSQLCLKSKPILLSNLYREQDDSSWQYQWSTGSMEKELMITHPGVYTLTITNEHGCASTESITIEKSCYLDIPNAFTPNGDGTNDYFFPRQVLSNQVVSIRIRILNQWGAVVFVSANRDGRGWDGNLNSVPQPVGVYVYVIDVLFDNGQEMKFEGNVTLLR